ncbi:MAG: RecB family exonuclease [Acidimicrobiales bacterium]
MTEPAPLPLPVPLALARALPLPSTLTPSKISAFTSCALAFRYSVVEQLPELPSLPAFRGTLVHRALQHFLTYTDAGSRDRAAAQASLLSSFELMRDDSELEALALDEAARAKLLAEATVLLDHYFELEDPNEVCPAGLELDMRVEIDGLTLRGIIDRLDVLPDGSFAVVDYKTGRAPRAEQAKSRLSGVQLYALLCEEILGRRPSVVRLLYLRDRVVVSAEPTDQTMRGVRQRARGVWQAIERACSRGDFRPNPSALCSWCAYQSLCPAFGGAVPDIAASELVEAAGRRAIAGGVRALVS